MKLYRQAWLPVVIIGLSGAPPTSAQESSADFRIEATFQIPGSSDVLIGVFEPKLTKLSASGPEKIQKRFLALKDCEAWLKSSEGKEMMRTIIHLESMSATGKSFKGSDIKIRKVLCVKVGEQ